MKRMTTLTGSMLSALLLSSVAMTQVATAQTEGPIRDQGATAPSTQATFESLDRNKDQRLSKSEAAADDGLSAQFATLDTNADGYINKSEYMRMHRPDSPAPQDSVPTPDPQS